MENRTMAAYKRAETRVKRIKGFYRHLAVYLVVNSMIVILGFGGLNAISGSSTELDSDFTVWIVWNIVGTPLLWGIGLVIHWFCVFGPGWRFVRNWEKRQLQRFLQEENRGGWMENRG